MEKMNAVVHFEMPAEDKKRMTGFYSTVFNWKSEQLGPEMGDYIVVQTTENDESGFPSEPGRINGGFADKSADFQTTRVVIAVDDIKDAMKKVIAAGGKVLGGQKPGVPDDIPGIGLYILFVDTEGNHVGLLQPTGIMNTSK